MKKKCLLLIIISFLFLEVNIFGNDEPTGELKNPYIIPKLTSKIKIDGIMEKNEWKDSLVMELKYEVLPGDNIKPPVETKFYIGYDSKNLYAAFQAYDPDPSKIRAYFTDRDNIWSYDYLSIMLDTFNDSRRCYHFACNPYGIQADEIILTGGYSEWDGIWNSAGKVNEEGFVVEIAIPFTCLRFQGKKEDQIWGIDVMRAYPRKVTHMMTLVPRDRDNDCYFCQFAKVVGFKGAKSGINLELNPTLFSVVTKERESFPEGKFVKKTSEIEPGLSVRWGFTSNLTLSTTINPDFSQVEADAAQLDINTQFALYYAEKRPFFQEGEDIYTTRLNAVYTRSVADPEWGIKLTGKEGKHALAFFTARDTTTNLIFPSSQRSSVGNYDEKNLSTMLRYRYDLGRSSNVGVLITDREGDDYYNRLAGIDGNIRFSKKDRIAFQLLGSQTRYPQEVAKEYSQSTDKLTGRAFDIYYTHKARNLSIYGQYKNIFADFRADVGFIEQTGHILYNIGGEYIWRRSPGHWFTRFNLGGGYLHNTDQDSNLLKKAFKGWVEYNGPLQSNINLDVNLGSRMYLGNDFNDNKIDISGGFRPTGSLYLYTAAGFGDQIDFANVRAGKRFYINPLIAYNLGRRIYFRLDHIFERLTVDAGRLYTANLSNFSMRYHFNRNAFLRIILQYADYQYNSSLYLKPKDSEYKHLFSQVLFSYKLNPRTVLFLGYSDDYYGYSYVPVKQNNYTFFMKVGYALVL